MRLNAHDLNREHLRSVDTWAAANGCRWHVCLEHPIVINGKWVECCTMCRRDPKSIRRNDWLMWRDGQVVDYKHKPRRFRIRVPMTAELRSSIAGRKS